MLKLVIAGARVIAIWIAMSSVAAANCTTQPGLARLVDVAALALNPDPASVSQRLTKLAEMTNGIDFGEVRDALSIAGQQEDFPTVRHVIAEIRVLASLQSLQPEVGAPDPTQDPAFRARLLMLSTIMSKACKQGMEITALTDDAGQEVLIGIKETKDGSEFNANIGASLASRAVAIVNQRIPGTSEALQKRMMIGFGIVMGLIFMALLYQAVLEVLRELRRQQQVCHIPAGFDCMLTDIPGAIVRMDTDGLAFAPSRTDPEEPRRKFKERDCCTVTVEGTRLSARISFDKSDTIGARFETPLSKQDLLALLAQSQTPVCTSLPAALRARLRRSLPWGRLNSIKLSES